MLKKIVVAIFIILITTSISLAFWGMVTEGTSQADTDDNIIIGDGTFSTSVVASLSSGLNPGETLVPQGLDFEDNQVTEVVLSFSVAWQLDERYQETNPINPEGTLSAEFSHFTIPNTIVEEFSNRNIYEEENNQLGRDEAPLFIINISDPVEIIVGGLNVDFDITINMNQPGTMELFNAIANQIVQFHFEFTVTPVN